MNTLLNTSYIYNSHTAYITCHCHFPIPVCTKSHPILYRWLSFHWRGPKFDHTSHKFPATAVTRKILLHHNKLQSNPYRFNPNDVTIHPTLLPRACPLGHSWYSLSISVKDNNTIISIEVPIALAFDRWNQELLLGWGWNNKTWGWLWDRKNVAGRHKRPMAIFTQEVAGVPVWAITATSLLLQKIMSTHTEQ